MEFFAKNVKYLRLQNKMTQGKLANKLGLKSCSTIQKWEDGTNFPTFATAQQLADILGCTTHELATENIQAVENSPDTDYIKRLKHSTTLKTFERLKKLDNPEFESPTWLAEFGKLNETGKSKLQDYFSDLLTNPLNLK